MQWTTGRWFVLGALIAISAVEVGAQQPDQPPRRGPRRGPDVEVIMQMRERLELSEDQIARLDEIRREDVERRSAAMAELAELRSQLRAGQIRRSEVMAFVEERRDADREAAEALRAQIESILTEDQLATVDELRARARAFRRGRVSVRRGPRGGAGLRGRPGARSGPRGIERGDGPAPPTDGVGPIDAAAPAGARTPVWRTEPGD